MTRDEKFIELAGRCATKSTILSRHGCVLVVHGKPVSYGFNHTRSYSHDRVIQGFSCHAEMDALRNAIKRKVFDKRLPKSIMYSTRLTRDCHYFDARPCQLCYQQMKNYGVCRIVYTIDTGQIETVRLHQYTPQYSTKGSEFMKTFTI